MSTNTKARIKSLIKSVNNIVSLVSSETQKQLKLTFKKVSIYPYDIDMAGLETNTLCLTNTESLNIKTLNPIFVVTRDFLKDKATFNPILSTIDLNKTKLFIDKLIKSINLHKTFVTSKAIPTDDFDVIFSKIADLSILPTFGSAKDFKIYDTTIAKWDISRISTPKMLQNTLELPITISKRSDAFSTNLPIEKKPCNMLSFSKNELEFFKEKLSQRANVNKRLIKINFIYDKLNLNNLQNIKFDPKNNCIYSNFKPKGELNNNNIYGYFIIGTRRDNLQSVNIMVRTADFDKIREQSQ